jgi:hypothetical protein
VAEVKAKSHRSMTEPPKARRNVRRAARFTAFGIALGAVTFWVAFAILPAPLMCPSFSCGNFTPGGFLNSSFSVAQVVVLALGGVATLLAFGLAVASATGHRLLSKQ